MGFTYHFHPEAEKELFDAIDYLDEQREGYGAILAEAAAQVLDQIIAHPQRFPLVLPSSNRRRALLPKPFHRSFAIYFDFEGTDILIISFFNTRRNPGVWQGRV